MIEILVVIGILAVLAAIVLLGMRHITGKSKEQQTRITLGNLRSMLAEYESATRLSAAKGPQQWPWYVSGSPQPVAVGSSVLGATVDFWRTPYYVSDESPGQEPNPDPDPMDAPGSVEVGNPLARNGSRQIVYTQLGMNAIYSAPANRGALQGLQTDRTFTPEFVTGTVPAPGSDRVLHTTDDTMETIMYYSGSRTTGGGAGARGVYRYVGPPTTAAPPGGGWELEGQEAPPRTRTSATPILLDGWGNPILLVPASGLRVRLLNGESRNDPAKAGQTVVIVSPEGSVTPAVMPGTPGKLIRAGRPFFVSAGPDGDFASGDDNIYSFEE